MGKYKGLFWPAILGVKHMPKVKESEFYNVAGGFRRATINDKIAFFLQHPVWEGRPELFMKTGSPKEIYAMVCAILSGSPHRRRASWMVSTMSWSRKG